MKTNGITNTILTGGLLSILLGISVIVHPVLRFKEVHSIHLETESNKRVNM